MCTRILTLDAHDSQAINIVRFISLNRCLVEYSLASYNLRATGLNQTLKSDTIWVWSAEKEQENFNKLTILPMRGLMHCGYWHRIRLNAEHYSK